MTDNTNGNLLLNLETGFNRQKILNIEKIQICRLRISCLDVTMSRRPIRLELVLDEPRSLLHAVAYIDCLQATAPRLHRFNFLLKVKMPTFHQAKDFHVITNFKIQWSFIGQFYCLQRGNVADYSSVMERVQWMRELLYPHLIANWPKTSLNILFFTRKSHLLSGCDWFSLVREWLLFNSRTNEKSLWPLTDCVK